MLIIIIIRHILHNVNHVCSNDMSKTLAFNSTKEEKIISNKINTKIHSLKRPFTLQHISFSDSKYYTFNNLQPY